MATDVKLDTEDVHIVARMVTITHPTDANTSVGVNLSNGDGFWHLSGPRNFEQQSPFSIYYNDTGKWVGPFVSIGKQGQVTLGNRTQLGDRNTQLTITPMRAVHCSGEAAGYSFSDRKVKDMVSEPKNGERWIWYADKGVARLWSGADILKITPDGKLTIEANGKSTTIEAGKVTVTAKDGDLDIASELAKAKEQIALITAELRKANPNFGRGR